MDEPKQKIHLATVATHNSGYMKWLIQSCSKFDTKLNILGYGQKWQGYAWKLLLILDFIKNLPENDIVCFIDGYDVIMLRDINEIIPIFNNIKTITNKKIIVGCDKIHFKPLKIISEITFNKCKGLPINTGTYIGNVKDLKYYIEKIMQGMKPDDDDQALFIKFCNKNEDVFYIDHDSLLFLTIEKPMFNFLNNKIKIIDGKLIYNGHRPFFAHGNGNTNMNQLVEKLGFNITTKEKKQLTKTHVFAIGRKIKYYSGFYKNYYLIMLFLLLIYYMNYYCKNKKLFLF